jgi:hypothetical protein
MINEIVNIDSGVRLSFAEIFRNTNLRIEIPIIQRDYAQGRDSAKKVRNTFLKALMEYLEEGKPNRDLDFVYGSIKHKDSYSNFVPLDGQQRLTTLFLLHWYFSLSKKEWFNEFQLLLSISENDRLISKFSYETRTSSKEFCDALISHGIDLTLMLPSDEGEQNSFSKTLRNKGWYFLSWDLDPTVKSMLKMLDSIHNMFKNKGHLYERLLSKDSPIITFFFLNLKEFKLTDDLYIKMNARGKPLTNFENFKAKFEQHFDNLKWSKEDDRKLTFDDQIKIVKPKEYFSFKIDTSWADLFWNYRGLVVNYDSYDEELMNYIRVLFSCVYAENVSSEKDDNLEFLIGTQIAHKFSNYTDDLTFEDFLELKSISANSINVLLNSLDVFANGTEKIRKRLIDSYYFDEERVFSSILSHTLNQVQRVRFYAYLQYLFHFSKDTSGFDDWMRVIFNLTENTVIDSAIDVAKAIQSLKKLGPSSNQILTRLRIDGFKVDFFSPRQVEEEKIKAHLIEKGEDWRDSIILAEKHPYLKGQIGFLIEFSGIQSYFHQYRKCDWNQEDDSIYFNSFTDYYQKAKSVFDIINTKNFLSTSKNMRDYSWKRLLRLTPLSSKSQDVQYWKVRREFVKLVFDDELFDKDDLTASLEQICKLRLPSNWRNYFITEPSLLAYSEQGFIRFESELSIVLFKQSQQNHYQKELKTFYFYLRELKGSDIIKPFGRTWYYEVRSGEEESCAVLDNLEIEGIQYELDIYHHKSSHGKGHFELRFFIAKGDNTKDNYKDTFEEKLTDLGYSWKNDFGYCIEVESENFLKSKINETNSILISLIN